MNLYSSIFTSGSLRKDVFIWIDCENNNHQYGFSIFSLLILCSSFPSLSSHLHEPDDAECGYCWGVIASLSYWSGSFKGKIKEVFVICLHRPDMKFSEAFRINTTLCVFVCFFFLFHTLLLWSLCSVQNFSFQTCWCLWLRDNCFWREGYKLEDVGRVWLHASWRA